MTKRYIRFDSPLEAQFYHIYKMLPFEMIEVMVKDGFTHEYAFNTVQLIIDNLWNSDFVLYQDRIRREKETLDNPLVDCPFCST